ncbi:MAG: helix-turn-helix transcriptional regulator [Gemmatimonadota bacterium]|jgi:putative transcriptional regulator|nr:helix-turn-helix transcriptional regulator [Gemmatimonadota bacterium]
MPKAEITNQIRKLRFEHGEMSQQALADQVGCTRQTILLLEQGRYVPSLALALRIARVFGQTVEEVFQLEGDS